MKHTPKAWVRSIPVLAIALFWTVPAGVSAGTIRVPLDQATLQDGINAASAGDTVLVAPGTYSGAGNRNLDFGGVDIVLISEGGPGVTIIDCDSEFDGLANGFVLENGETSDAVIEGFTIRNCWAPHHPTYANSGGGMLLVSASPTVTSVNFENNEANGGSGAGIACTSGSSPLITDCAFTGNYTNNYGSAVFCTQGSSPSIVGCRVEGNTGNGAIAVASSAPVIQATLIRGNQGIDSRGGAGLRFSGTADVNVSQCLITGNKANAVARGGGGVILFDTALAYFSKCDIAGNTSADVGGGILLASGSDADLTLQESVLWGNCAASDGDQIYLDSATGTIQVFCSDIDSAGVVAAGISYDVNTIFQDPLYCDPLDCLSAPSTGGDYSVNMFSPVLPENNACGFLMGNSSVGCGPVKVTPTTWGNLKNRFRDR